MSRHRCFWSRCAGLRCDTPVPNHVRRLKSIAKYDGEYRRQGAKHPVIERFWRVMAELSETERAAVVSQRPHDETLPVGLRLTSCCLCLRWASPGDALGCHPLHPFQPLRSTSTLARAAMTSYRPRRLATSGFTCRSTPQMRRSSQSFCTRAQYRRSARR